MTQYNCTFHCHPICPMMATNTQYIPRYETMYWSTPSMAALNDNSSGRCILLPALCVWCALFKLTQDGVHWTKLNRNLHHAQANTIHADTGLSVCLSVCALAVRAFPDTSLIEQSMDSQHSCISCLSHAAVECMMLTECACM